jgi:hypothetical protein
MFSIEKVKPMLLIVLIVGGIFASWAFGINQVSNMVENAQELRERSAVAECVVYAAPHALIIEGEIFCYRTTDGSERILPLKTLQEMFGVPQSQDQGE